jgi:2',3'-cyclic-nucleotide 2'-phosphodiesterase (5'-nucleotidase family)
MFKPKFHFLIFVLAFLVSCNGSFRSSSVQYNNYQVQQTANANSAFAKIIKPYSDSINISMSDVVGINESLLEKKVRQNTLGYFMADAFLFEAKQKFGINVEVAFMNYGGIRLIELPPGKITKGKLFELMPFDNLLVLQKLKGSVLKQYLDTLAMGETVVLSGITMSIENKRTKNILVGGLPLDESRDYIIANSEYNIGTSEVLKKIAFQNIGYLQRDALIDYVTYLNIQGKKIVVENINRISYAQ